MTLMPVVAVEEVVAVAEAVVVAAVEEVSAAAVAAAGFPAADHTDRSGSREATEATGAWAVGSALHSTHGRAAGTCSAGITARCGTQILPGCREGARQAPLTGQHDKLNAPQSAPPGRMSGPRTRTTRQGERDTSREERQTGRTENQGERQATREERQGDRPANREERRQNIQDSSLGEYAGARGLQENRQDFISDSV